MTKKMRILILTIAALITFISAAVIVFYRHYYPLWLDKESKTDIFFGQSQFGICTHDDSYTDPIMPNGRYYTRGEGCAPYYVEITENRYCQLKPADGKTETIVMIAYENNQVKNNIGDKKEFKLITNHCDDNIFFCHDWEEVKRFDKNDFRGEVLPAEIRSGDWLEVNEFRGEKLLMKGGASSVITDENNDIIGFNSLEYHISPDYGFDFIYCDKY